MVTLTATVEQRGDASMVELVVANETPVPRRVRVANKLDGPVWPPRSEGVPVDGWDDGGFEGIVEPGERLGLGYASPADPTDPPAEIAWSERAAEREPERASRLAATGKSEIPDGDSEILNEHSPVYDLERADDASVVRALGDPRPPRDVVEEFPGIGQSDGGGRDSELPDTESGGASHEHDAPPEAIEAWFEPAEARVERGDALTEPSSLLDAASAVEQEGSLTAVERLVTQLEDDVEALRQVERRAAALAGRAETAADEVPVSPFRRLS